MITARGAGVLAAAITVFVLARLTQVGWLYLLDALLWGITLLSAALPWSGVAALSAYRRLERQGFSKGLPGPSEGESVKIELALLSRALWPSFFLKVSYNCPVAEPASRLLRFFIARLGRSSPISLTSTVQAHQRGMHHLEPVVVESAAPFGLFRRRVRLLAPLSVLVYPQVYPLRRLWLLDARPGTAMQTKKSRVGPETVGSRHYFPGDPLRYIHWRNTARTGQPMVKEFEDPRDQTVCLCFGTAQVWGQGRETTLEYAVKVVASVAGYTLKQGVSVRVWGGNLHGALVGAGLARPLFPEGSYISWLGLLQSLALVAPGTSPQPSHPPLTKRGITGGIAQALGQIPPGANTLVVVSVADRQGLQAILRSAPALHRLVVVVLEGFGEPPQASEVWQALEQAPITLVRCHQGRLAEALQALEQLNKPDLDRLTSFGKSRMNGGNIPAW